MQPLDDVTSLKAKLASENKAAAEAVLAFEQVLRDHNINVQAEVIAECKTSVGTVVTKLAWRRHKREFSLCIVREWHESIFKLDGDNLVDAKGRYPDGRPLRAILTPSEVTVVPWVSAILEDRAVTFPHLERLAEAIKGEVAKQLELAKSAFAGAAKITESLRKAAGN